MKIFLRFVLPVTYFQATRLNRWALVGYNGLVEWVPAILLSLYFSGAGLRIVPIVLISYAAFICIYEIGYITNDFYSERFEDDPRGRRSILTGGWGPVIGLIASRIAFFLLFTFLADAMQHPLWWAFYLTLLVTFGLHNLLPGGMRVPSFFALSTYRFFGPLILSLSAPALGLLLPAILLNNSLYRTTVYLRNKEADEAREPKVSSKFAFYAACLPVSLLFSVVQQSVIPAAICIYFMLVWLLYWMVSRIFPSAARP